MISVSIFFLGGYYRLRALLLRIWPPRLATAVQCWEAMGMGIWWGYDGRDAYIIIESYISKYVHTYIYISCIDIYMIMWNINWSYISNTDHVHTHIDTHTHVHIYIIYTTWNLVQTECILDFNQLRWWNCILQLLEESGDSYSWKMVNLTGWSDWGAAVKSNQEGVIISYPLVI